MHTQTYFGTLSSRNPLTYFFLAFITMAGLSYINFMPGVVNALAGGIGFSDAEAGQIIAANGYGGLIGSSIAIFLVRHIHWKPILTGLLIALSLIEIGTSWISTYGLMLGWRFLAGTVGWLALGIGFAVLARLANPDRAFGSLLFIQFCIGTLVIYLLQPFEEILGDYAVFFIMASFLIFGLIFLIFLPQLSLNNTKKKQNTAASENRKDPFLLMMAILVYQIAASAIWAYVGVIGLSANISAEDSSLYIATTGMLGLVGALLPIISGNRIGRIIPIALGVSLSVAGTIMLIYSYEIIFYVMGMALLFFSWPAVQSYLLAVSAEIDASGRLSTIAAVISSIGLATGPLMASYLIEQNDHSTMLYVCSALFVLSQCFLFKPVQQSENKLVLSHS